MQFQQDFELQVMSKSSKRVDFLLAQVGGDEQNGVGSDVSRLEELVFV